ncbi:hypothetical protein ACFQY8_04200 [Alloscardovia venturai]|uniref:Periplasmic binding protein domain-containing protein n=1 Tax=Alloscardovia venturai TaxID=1769421 RepID=A0ABW2Y8L7_9BIFI
MTIRRMRRYTLTVISIIALAFATACGSPSVSSHSSASLDSATVDILTPSSNNLIDPHTPINSWSSLVSHTKISLQSRGFSHSHIYTHTSRSVLDQIKKINSLTAQYKKSASHRSTIVIAPLPTQKNSNVQTITSHFGDYVTLNREQDTNENSAITTEEKQEEKNLEHQLATSLQRAHDSGIHVIVLANKVSGFEPDYFVEFSSARTIARIQTDNLVKKLRLTAATRKKPKAIEILLPMNAGASFCRELFDTTWKILKPYYATGVAYSPSGLLTTNSSTDDWRNVSVADDSAAGIQAALEVRLTSSSKSPQSWHTIDGILAYNDYIALSTVTALDHMGFTGTSDTVNPDITLESIVNSLSGHGTINKQEVPEPHQWAATHSTENTDTSSSSQSSSVDHQQSHNDTSRTKHQWPIITGYGICISSVSRIVDGKIWVSAMEDRMQAASTITILTEHESTSMSTSRLKELIGSINTTKKEVTNPLFAVNADNFKKTMLDTGYVNPADAGL